MKVNQRKITDYIPDDENANTGTERGSQMLENSLHEVGAGRSLVADASGHIVAGNKTLQAAVDAGITDVIEVETDGRSIIVHKRTDWTLEDKHGAARKYAYLDNRVGQVSLNWDAAQIAADVEAGVNLDAMFTPAELNMLVNDSGNNPYDEWQGMPEFEQESINAFHSIKVNFADEQALNDFAKLIGQKITPKTVYINHPYVPDENLKPYQVVDES